MGAAFWHNRGRRLLPTSAAERELWTIWLGYLGALIVQLLLVVRLLHGQGWWRRGPDSPAELDQLIVYPR